MSDTHSPWGLARLAGVASPDTLDSPGAIWLVNVASAVQDILDALPASTDNVADYISDAADQLIPVYTHDRWKVFVDLAAYNENVTDIDGPIRDMTQAAGVALYLIAERLLGVLVQEAERSTDDPDDDPA